MSDDLELTDLNITFDNLQELIEAAKALIRAVNNPSSNHLIDDCLKRYEAVLKIKSCYECVKIFWKCFHWQINFIKREHSMYNDDTEVRAKIVEHLMRIYGSTKAEDVQGAIKNASHCFRFETQFFDGFDFLYSSLMLRNSGVYGFSGQYIFHTWNPDHQKNKAEPETFKNLAKFDLTRGLSSAHILFSICSGGAFHLIKVTTFLRRKT